MRNTLKTVATSALILALGAQVAMASPDCRTGKLEGNWTLTFNGYFPDREGRDVDVEHVFLACDARVSQTGALNGTCQDMYAFDDDDDPVFLPLGGDLRLNRRSCAISGTATLGSHYAGEIEGHVVGTNGRRTDVAIGNVFVTLPQPLARIGTAVLNFQMNREPWGGSRFAIDN